jgi:hypothetical protein
MAVAIRPYLTDAEITKDYSYPSISASPSSSSGTSSALLLRSLQDKLPPPGFFGVLIQSLHPEACLKACYGGEYCMEGAMPLEPTMAEIIDCIETESQEERLAGLEALHILVDKNHVTNRYVRLVDSLKEKRREKCREKE